VPYQTPPKYCGETPRIDRKSPAKPISLPLLDSRDPLDVWKLQIFDFTRCMQGKNWMLFTLR
jgi:hypothetical protein